ncbi:MAG TPA: hypothetical protein VE733_05070 [Streptosporangiaceae bacterium]|nr:hypothetical protein [Streptosporangiaceae bacterium]
MPAAVQAARVMLTALGIEPDVEALVLSLPVLSEPVHAWPVVLVLRALPGGPG